MKRNFKIRVLLVWAVILSASSMLVFAAVGAKNANLPVKRAQPVSDRLIVKFKASKTDKAMSAEQKFAEMSRPLSTGVMQQLQSAAGTPLTDLRTTGTGAHVLLVDSLRGKQTVAQAVAAISKLPDVEYAEEDAYETIQAVPNDTNYGNIGLWGLWPVSAVTGAAPGGTGSYGADFQTAWDTSTGSGVVVAVIDTGITPHPDIVGASGVVAAGPDSNLISPGYTFITDCRNRGVTASGGCAASTMSGTDRAPSPGATDTGDYITVQDNIDNSLLFPEPTPPQTLPIDSSWHGTHVAGTIAAIGNNNQGVIGGAYGAKILPIRALGKMGGLGSDVSDAIRWAAGLTVSGVPVNPHPAKVINLSLGAPGSCSPERQAAITAAVNAGAVVVVAAGNENMDVAGATPANCQNVISVAAVARDGSRAYYSNYSSPTTSAKQVKVTLAAQGGDQSPVYAGFDPGILSTLNDGLTIPGNSTYGYYQGTSMATPHVSAAVALMLAYNPALTPARVKQILSTPAALTAFPTFSPASFAAYDCAARHNCGAGILNANLALQNSTTTAPDSGGGGGGGGCAIMPLRADPDVSLLLALLAVGVYWLRRRIVGNRGAA